MAGHTANRRRWLSRGIAFLAAGAGMTVVIAWVCGSAEHWPTAVQTRTTSPAMVDLWLRHRPGGIAEPPPTELVRSRVGTTYTVAYTEMLRGGSFRVQRWRQGWPLGALERHTVVAGAFAQRTHFDSLAWTLWPMPTGVAFHLPIRPLWTGFVADTLIFSALVAAAWWAPQSARRWIRLKRGRCPACRYPIGVREVCTECGQALSQHRRSGGGVCDAAGSSEAS